MEGRESGTAGSRAGRRLAGLPHDNDLAPEAAEALCDAVRDAYNKSSLKRLLLFRCDGIKLEDIVSGANFEETVFEVFLAAKRHGWLMTVFIPQVLAGNPGNPMLTAWAGKYWTPRQATGMVAAGPAPAWQIMDSAYFDLEEVRSRIRGAMKESSGAVGFGVTYPESTFVRKLSDWVRGHAGATESKDRLYLSPVVSSPEYRLRQVREYRRLLDAVNVLCEVVVDGALSDDAVADFWTGVRRDFGESRNRLILVFIGARPWFPEGITMLPHPEFTRPHVESWTETLVRQRGWPLDLAADWTTWLCERASGGGQPEFLDVRMLYEAMDNSVQDFQMAAPEEFRARLRKEREHAIPSPG
jgi:hypothetical protein